MLSFSLEILPEPEIWYSRYKTTLRLSPTICRVAVMYFLPTILHFQQLQIFAHSLPSPLWDTGHDGGLRCWETFLSCPITLKASDVRKPAPWAPCPPFGPWAPQALHGSRSAIIAHLSPAAVYSPALNHQQLPLARE